MKTCQACGVNFKACDRAKYCSSACKKHAWYHKHKHEEIFKQHNNERARLARSKHGNIINARRRERFKIDKEYRQRTRQCTILSRERKPQNDNYRVWLVNHPYKGMIKNLRKRGKRLVNEHDLYLIFERDNNQCQYCGSRESLSLDHRLPISRGGDSSIDNLCVACKSCNSRKSAKTPEEFLIYRREAKC